MSRALLISDRPDAEDSALIRAAAAAAGLAVTTCASSRTEISRALDADDAELAIIAPDVPEPSVAARTLRRRTPQLRVLLVTDRDAADLRRELGHEPGGTPATARPVADELQAALRRLLGQATRQRRVRTTLDRINIQLATRPVLDPVDYRRLVLSDRFLTAMADATPDVVIATDMQGRLVRCNRTAERLLGRPSPALIGELLEAVCEPTLARALRSAVERIAAGAERVVADAAVSDGAILFEVITVPVQGDGRRIGALSVARDMTVRRTLERRLRDRADQLQVAARQKDEFLMIVSHELRTPLTAILGWSRMLQQGVVVGQAKSRHALEVVERNAQSLTQLVGDLLDVARIANGKVRLDVRPIDPAIGVSAAVDAVRPSAQAKKLRLEVILDPKAGTIAADADRLQQIAWNLLTNAVKFTPKGGRIQVRLERVNSSIELVVSDNGPGIAPDFVPYAFDRFRQQEAGTTRVHGGLGLGLAIVRQLAELHGGSVSIESPPAGGATVRVSLPVLIAGGDAHIASRLHPVAEGSAPSVLPLARLDGTSVLLVDDDADSRKVLATMLFAAGAEVHVAASGDEALSALAELTPTVLISDVEMPGMDGFTFIRHVRTLPGVAAAVPAIALTAHARTEDRLAALNAGFHHHVAKPCDPAELTATVASLAGRRA